MPPPTIIATPGASDANSYETVVEADAYFNARLPLVPPWASASPSKEALLIMGTRVLDAMFRGQKTLVTNDKGGYYRISRKWNGSPATTTQKLAWPRVGLFHDNGAEIAADEIPWELKDAESEMAGQLGVSDRTLDDDIVTQGITSVKAGSVAVTFKNTDLFPNQLPQAVIDLIPPSWYTEEVEQMAQKADFGVVL